MFDDYDAVVYDLDGTLVDLDVSWDAVHADAAAAYRDAGVDPADHDLWGLLENAAENGLSTTIERVISRHERDGARSSTRLPLADALADERRPVGVCTLNCEEAAHIALDVHDIARHVDAVVGRDTVENHKPHPDPLLETIESLGLEPVNVVFVGDSDRDEVTAGAAGTGYAYAAEILND